MPRIRSLKADFFLDSALCKKPPLARLLFAGLWVYADRRGILEEDQERLKIQILPYDKAEMEPLLACLSPKHVVRYAKNGKNLIWIRNFIKHQKPHPKEPDSDLPLPSTAQEKHGKTLLSPEKTRPAVEKHAGVPVGAVNGSLVLGSGVLALGMGVGTENRAFRPPTPKEVEDYGKEIGYKINGVKFVNHYEANGWIRGKTKMRSWQATVRYWKDTDENPKPAPAGKSDRERWLKSGKSTCCIQKVIEDKMKKNIICSECSTIQTGVIW